MRRAGGIPSRDLRAAGDPGRWRVRWPMAAPTDARATVLEGPIPVDTPRVPIDPRVTGGWLDALENYFDARGTRSVGIAPPGGRDPTLSTLYDARRDAIDLPSGAAAWLQRLFDGDLRPHLGDPQSAVRGVDDRIEQAAHAVQALLHEQTHAMRPRNGARPNPPLDDAGNPATFVICEGLTTLSVEAFYFEVAQDTGLEHLAPGIATVPVLGGYTGYSHAITAVVDRLAAHLDMTPRSLLRWIVQQGPTPATLHRVVDHVVDGVVPRALAQSSSGATLDLVRLAAFGAIVEPLIDLQRRIPLMRGAQTSAELIAFQTLGRVAGHRASRALDDCLRDVSRYVRAPHSGRVERRLIDRAAVLLRPFGAVLPPDLAPRRGPVVAGVSLRL